MIETIDTKDFLSKLLQDPTEAAAYLNATFEEADQSLTLLALRDIVDAFGFTQVADAAELSRENLYRMLSAEGNPRLSSLFSLLKAIGLRLAVEPDQAASKEIPEETRGLWSEMVISDEESTERSILTSYFSENFIEVATSEESEEINYEDVPVAA